MRQETTRVASSRNPYMIREAVEFFNTNKF